MPDVIASSPANTTMIHGCRAQKSSRRASRELSVGTSWLRLGRGARAKRLLCHLDGQSNKAIPRRSKFDIRRRPRSSDRHKHGCARLFVDLCQTQKPSRTALCQAQNGEASRLVLMTTQSASKGDETYVVVGDKIGCSQRQSIQAPSPN